MHTIRLTPLEEDTGTRLDSFLSRRVEGLTRSAAARLLAEGCVTCDGAVPGKSYRIVGGEELCVTLPEAEEPEAVPQDIPLDVVYEDEDVIVVNKPVGMVVHPAPAIRTARWSTPCCTTAGTLSPASAARSALASYTASTGTPAA